MSARVSACLSRGAPGGMDRVLRVLVVHNSYRERGGEDVVVEAEEALLRSHGCYVERHGAANDAIEGPWAKLEAAWHAPYSRAERARLARRIAAVRPDIVHAHNFFPLLTPSVYDACAEAGVPVVQTLHNYRTICPAATFYRDGKVCEECLHGSAWHAVRHGCYRRSRLGSAAVARMVERHRAAGLCPLLQRPLELGFGGSRVRGRRAHEGGQDWGELDCVADAEVHALPAHRRVDVRRVPDEEHGAALGAPWRARGDVGE